MNSRGTIWAWRVAGLALAMMAGIAARRLASNQEPVPVGPAPTPNASPQALIVPRGDQQSTTPSLAPRLPSRSDAKAGPSTLDPRPSTLDALSVAYETARTDPVHALELAADLPSGLERDRVITHAAAAWAAKTPEAAAAWATQLTDPALREQVMAGIAATWSETDPKAAADWALKSLGPGKPLEDAIVSVMQRWTQQSPEDAAAWVSAFPSGNLRDTAVEELVKLWTDKNFEAAGKWLAALDPGAIRDIAAGAYANKMVIQFPETAARWAAAIQDDSLRVRKLEAIGELWLAIDAFAARAWIAQSPLPDPAKTRLLANR